MDYNGTLACKEELLEGVRDRLNALSNHLEIHVLTQNTSGEVAAQLPNFRCPVHILLPEALDQAKQDYVIPPRYSLLHMSSFIPYSKSLLS